MKLIWALSPVLILFFLLFIRKLPFFKASAFTFASTILITTLAWSLPAASIGPVVLKTALLTLDILLIVFGAVFFLNELRETGRMQALANQLQALTPDRRIQGILLAWLLGGFIEGTSGFGTPAAVVAPLLVGIGFNPFTAVTICLLANSTAVAFGAIGTPLRVGLAGFDLEGVAEKAAFVNALVGMGVPPAILATLVRSEPGPWWPRFREGLPWALFAGFAFSVPYFAFARIGYEFPSVLGAATGLGLAFLSLKSGFLVPGPAAPPRVRSFAMGQAFFPYVLLLGLLILGKVVFSGVQTRLDLGGGLSHTIQFFNPGFAFLTVVAILSVTGTRTVTEVANSGIRTARPLGKVAASIFFTAGTTYLMVSTGLEGRAGMLEILARPLETPALPFFSVVVGAFGAFLAGSATVSNLLFGPLQAQAAESVGYAPQWILALQLVGAGAGNMIALPNLLAVEAAVGLRDQEAKLLRRLALPCGAYLMLAGIVGMCAAT